MVAWSRLFGDHICNTVGILFTGMIMHMESLVDLLIESISTLKDNNWAEGEPQELCLEKSADLQVRLRAR